jgi:hypothetical protein
MKTLNNRPQRTSYGTLGLLCLRALNLARYRRAYERKFTSSLIPVAGFGSDHWMLKVTAKSKFAVKEDCVQHTRSFTNFFVVLSRQVLICITAVRHAVASIPTTWRCLPVLNTCALHARWNLVQLIVDAAIHLMPRIPGSGPLARMYAEYAARWLRKDDGVWHILQVERIQTERIVKGAIWLLPRVPIPGEVADTAGFADFWPKRNSQCHNKEMESY